MSTDPPGGVAHGHDPRRRAGHEHDRDYVDKDVSGAEPVEREGDYTDTLVLEGERYPLFWWRADPQVDMMHDLAPERKNGLVASVAALLGGATGRVAFHQVQFAFIGITFGAISQFTRQTAAA